MTTQCCKGPAKLRNTKSSNRIRYPLTVRVLVMEDEKRVARFIRGALADVGFAVELCRDPGTNVVDAYIRRLREKIDDPFAQKLIHTVRGAGYKAAETP
jgi:DNA-binding response OmpR family regulator